MPIPDISCPRDTREGAVGTRGLEGIGHVHGGCEGGDAGATSKALHKEEGRSMLGTMQQGVAPDKHVCGDGLLR